VLLLVLAAEARILVVVEAVTLAQQRRLLRNSTRRWRITGRTVLMLILTLLVQQTVLSRLLEMLLWMMRSWYVYVATFLFNIS